LSSSKKKTKRQQFCACRDAGVDILAFPVVFPNLGPTGSSVDRRFASPRFSVAPSEATTRGTGSWDTWSKPSAHPAVKCGSCPRGTKPTRISARVATPKSSALRRTRTRPSKNFPTASANSASSSKSSRRIEDGSEQSASRFSPDADIELSSGSAPWRPWERSSAATNRGAQRLSRCRLAARLQSSPSSHRDQTR